MHSRTLLGRSVKGRNPWFKKSTKRRTGLAILGLVLLTASGCSGYFSDQARQRLESLPITLTALEANLSLSKGLKVRATCKIENVNATWVMVNQVDYCLWVNNVKTHCDRFPSANDTIRLGANDTIIIQEVTSPAPEVLATLTAALARRPTEKPHAVLKGQASISSAVGELNFPFTTQPLELEMSKLRLRVNL